MTEVTVPDQKFAEPVALSSTLPVGVRFRAGPRASYRKMVQNLAWAAGYNLVASPSGYGVKGVTLGLTQSARAAFRRAR